MKVPSNAQSLEQIIESICEQGCDKVNETIAQLSAGNAPKQMMNMSKAQQQVVLAALKDIMRVYQA